MADLDVQTHPLNIPSHGMIPVWGFFIPYYSPMDDNRNHD